MEQITHLEAKVSAHKGGIYEGGLLQLKGTDERYAFSQCHLLVGIDKRLI